MLDRYKRFFSPPVLPDADQARTAELLNIMLWAALAADLVYVCTGLLTRANSAPLLFGIALLISLSLLLLLLRRGAVRLTIVPDLPDVLVDRVRLVEVVQNLLDNAVKFMGSQIEPHLEIGVRDEENRRVFFVHDNGVGIDLHYHNRVFGLFDKLDPKSEGTGVGLALVKRIIEVHGGRVWVESAGLGQVASFCFTLPVPD